MDKAEGYFKQSQLMLEILSVLEWNDFALKGGTAINYFFRDLPRLSVDIDLTYLKSNSREKAIEEINNYTLASKERIESLVFGTKAYARYLKNEKIIRRLDVEKDGVFIKIEPNLTLRSCVYQPKEMNLTKNAVDKYNQFATAKCLSFEDIYAGKLCAALSRQHPRDLFDVGLLLKNEGITKKLIKAFIVYLISASRPINEMLAPNKIDLKYLFDTELKGMLLNEDMSYNELLEVREQTVKEIKKLLSNDEKLFLISFKQGEPDWHLLDMDSSHIRNLPAVKWKLININKMDKDKHRYELNRLQRVLE